MVGALDYFYGIPTEKVKKIAIEIARIGARGISPDKDEYTLPSIVSETFSGFRLLEYYYVS